ncbi:hypothetical protein BH23ACT2_BH23ACT2_26330 [soil metagenome]
MGGRSPRPERDVCRLADSPVMRLSAAGLTIDIANDGTVRVGWAEADWFGPATTTRDVLISDTVEVTDDLGTATAVTLADGDVRCSVRAYAERPMAVFRTEARTDLTGLATGAYDQPSVGWPVFTPADRVDGGCPEGLRAVAFQQCEFGLPSNAKADLDGFFMLPHRPPTGWPLLLVAPDGRTLMLAPLDAFHDQVVGLNGGTVRGGWNGDLDTVPTGFATDLAVIAGDGPRACLDTWGRLLRERAGTVRPGRWPDALGSRPSYWTDNGAAYWYRTEPDHDPAGSIVAAVTDLRDRGVPVGAVQLDSWFYPHTELRPFDTDDWVVPPSAMVAWEERPDVLPEGIADLRRRLGDPPLVAHIRHLSSDAPIAAEVPVHVDGPYAAPATAEAYERWLDQCVAWGVATFEHDWLVEVFFGVRGLREQPGRARAWQEGMDRAARERGITTQWCMATPADMAQTTTLTQVTSVRTCGDHGYIATAGQLWVWFCTTNALARSLGLMPFKDVFRADPEVAGDNGEPEALLSALSTGPVGLGDRVGRFDPALAQRTCRADGLLIKPHVPIAATDASMVAAAGFTRRLLAAECYSDHPAGRWSYVLALHGNPSDDELVGEIALDALGESAPAGDVVVWDWRTGTATRMGPDGTWPVALSHEGWVYLVCAPVLPGGIAVVGDVSRFVPAGDARLEVTVVDDGVRLVVKGAGETVTVTGWAEAPPNAEGADGPVRHDAATGVWTLDVAVPSRGWATVHLRP